MSVSFKKTALTLTHDVAPKCKRIEIEPEQSQPQIIWLLVHAPKTFCFSSSPLRRDLCVFRREPGDREKRIPNGSLCGGESLSFVTKLSKSKKSFGSIRTGARLNNSWEYPPWIFQWIKL